MAKEKLLEISEGVARRFLQTIVVVDDEAFINNPPGAEQPTLLIEPPPRGQPEQAGTQIPEIAIAPDDNRPPAMFRQLDAKLLIDSFALQGLVCAILAPGENEQLERHVQALSENADVIVLDWTIHRDGGATAIRIVNDIMERDQKRGGRIRLIVIYTGEPDVGACCKVLLERIRTLRQVDGDELALQHGTTRVVFCRKKHDGGEAGIESYKESELPNRVVREFTTFAGGVLPNCVMSSVAAIRERTHSIVGRFNSSLDGPFLAHRVLLDDVDDADGFLIDLIGDEIKAILESTLEDTAVESAAALDAFVKVTCEKQEFRTVIEAPEKPVRRLAIEEVLAGVVSGQGGLTGSWGSAKTLYRRIHPLFHATPDAGRERSQRFAALSALRRDLTLPRPEHLGPPSLNLGTLISRTEGDKERFLVCLQPVCDCVRRSADRKHPFIFGTLTEAEKGFDVVVPNSKGKYSQLHFEDKAPGVVMLSFAGSASGRVEASSAEGGFWFSPGDGPRWQWLGELRDKHAQRFVQRLASQLSRIGLDEFEWQRQHAE